MVKEDKKYIIDLIDKINEKSKMRGWNMRIELEESLSEYPETMWITIKNRSIVQFAKPFEEPLNVIKFLEGFWAAYKYLP